MCQKMVGLAYAVAAGLAPESSLETALTEHSEQSQGREVPTAPGECLYLAECSYAKYEQKHKAAVHNTEPCKAAMAAFKRRIREHVARLDHRDGVFTKWSGEDGELAKWCRGHVIADEQSGEARSEQRDEKADKREEA